MPGVRSWCSGSGSPTDRRPRRSVASGSTISTSSGTRARGSACTCASTCPSWSGRCSRRSGSIGRERFALVQVHSLPDFLVFAALPLAPGRRSGAARSARGHARVLPQPVPGRIEPDRPSIAAAPGAAVDRAGHGGHHGQPGDARPARAAGRSGCQGRRRRSTAHRFGRFDDGGLPADGPSARTGGSGSSTRVR